MLDFMEYCLRRYYYSINWREDQYSTLLTDSRRLLDFAVPHGFSITLGKTISPVLKGTYTLGIPNIRSVGFLFTSAPLDLPPMHLKDEGGLTPSCVDDLKVYGKAGINCSIPVVPSTHEAIKSSDTGNYLVYGRLFEDLRLEALYSKSLSRNTLIVASGVNSWKPRAPNSSSSVNTQLLYSSLSYSSELSYSSDDHVIGLSGLYRFSGSNWSAGSEVYYTAKERSGGLSLGARYKNPSKHDAPAEPKTVLTFLANPMMGHVSASYATTIRKNLTMATRYDFNVYSYEADLVLGVEYAPPEKEQLVKARVSLSEGLALKLEGQYKRALFSIGLMTQFVHNPRRSIGIELQIS
ncbi:hypothetical protein SpCBS45565_g03719 [Spizellomyces sp. 'palustris']|nr:hypothetical protein SpCBS45565_g03719 [Spizellomyces sp. 'palustris']